MPGREELPSALRRPSKKAQDTWIKAHDSAVEEYGEGERSHRTAYGALNTASKRSSMNKKELAAAIQKANDHQTRQARSE